MMESLSQRIHIGYIYIYTHVQFDRLAGPFQIAVRTPLQAGPESSPRMYMHIYIYVLIYMYIGFRVEGLGFRFQARCI